MLKFIYSLLQTHNHICQIPCNIFTLRVNTVSFTKTTLRQRNTIVLGGHCLFDLSLVQCLTSSKPMDGCYAITLPEATEISILRAAYLYNYSLFYVRT